jgi:hypothetical protein
MNTAPRRSPRIAAKMTAPVARVAAPVAHVAAPVARVAAPVAHVAAPVAHVAPRRSPRIAAQMAARAPVAPAPAPAAPAPARAPAPAPTTPRRSPRFVEKPVVVYCADGSSYKRNPSHWTTNPYYIGLIPHACAKLDNDRKAVREYLDRIEAAKGIVAKADVFIEMYRYLCSNDLLLLRIPKFRQVAMKKLEVTNTDQYTITHITPTQRRIIAAQYKLFTERYRTMVGHPLFIA